MRKNKQILGTPYSILEITLFIRVLDEVHLLIVTIPWNQTLFCTMMVIFVYGDGLRIQMRFFFNLWAGDDLPLFHSHVLVDVKQNHPW